MIEVITNRDEWNSLINEVDSYDFYSTYDYHMISNENGEKPIMLKYTQEETVIGLPLLIREIEGTTYFDATSVYGYAGPISKNMTEDFDNQKFEKSLNDFFESNQIVAVFSRLNPFIPNQDIILKNIGQIIVKGDVVTIDLTKELEMQRQQYQRRIKSHINKARKICTVKKAETKKDITNFINLYYENMERVEAKKSYFFSEDYFYEFAQNDHSEIDILLASLNETNEVISGAMFIKTKDIIQYHLSGTKTEYLYTSALKLLIDEMRIYGTEENYRVFNLGGGLKSQEDSLLRFKKSFSKQLDKFSVWQHIVNDEVYKDLEKQKHNGNPDFFPSYRSPG